MWYLKGERKRKRILVGKLITNNNKNCNSKITSKYGSFSILISWWHGLWNIFKFKNFKKSFDEKNLSIYVYQWGKFYYCQYQSLTLNWNQECQQNYNRRIYWQEPVRKFIFALDAGQIWSFELYFCFTARALQTRTQS